jgi:hypothetical protein
MAHKVPFLVAELGPDVDPFVLHLFAALAEKERALISTRTRQALEAAKVRGVAEASRRTQDRRGLNQGQCRQARGEHSSDHQGSTKGRGDHVAPDCGGTQRERRGNGARRPMARNVGQEHAGQG